MTKGNTVQAEDIKLLFPAPSRGHTSQKLSDAVDDFERTQIEEALKAEGGSMTRAAERLGLERSHLYKKMKKLGLEG